MRLRPQPWHDVAREMRAAGATYEQISEIVDRHVATVVRLLRPNARERQNALRRTRYATDPVFRAKECERVRRQAVAA